MYHQLSGRANCTRSIPFVAVLLAATIFAGCGTRAVGPAGAAPTAIRAATPGRPGAAVAPADSHSQFAPIILESAIWHPKQDSSWQWQLSALPVDQSVDVPAYDIDAFDNDASVVAALHARGRKVICYINAGAWENWRPDAGQFPETLKGGDLEGWPGEKWLDIRNLAALGPLIEARMDLCKAKGFDAIEPDNVDGYANDSGFPLSPQDQIAYNTFLANAAHTRGLSVGLKNDLDQVVTLEPLFDWVLNEQCFQYAQCHLLAPFLKAGKAVFQVEYELAPSAFCPQARAMHISSMRKHLALDAYRVACS